VLFYPIQWTGFPERVAGWKNGCCDRALFDMLVCLISLFRFFKGPLSIDTFLKHVHLQFIFQLAVVQNQFNMLD
jgi:hypothetical protein